MNKLKFAALVSLLTFVPSAFADSVTTSVFALGGSAGGTAPDSITVGNGSVWVAYTNGADSTGLSGSSLVVQYDNSGNIQHTYTLAGYVDGLKINPNDGKVWALQNQDGNSTLTIIDPTTNTAGKAVPFSVTSGTRGYDDVAFNGGKTFVSYTNPVNGTDPIVQQLNAGSNPLTIGSNLLTQGASGKNLATGLTGMITATDPDSLKTTPGGGLVLTSGADGQLIFIADPGGSNTVSFLQLLDPKTGLAVPSLDDALFPNTTSGTFYLADTGNNRVLAIHDTGIGSGALYAAVTGLNEFALVDQSTGDVTSIVGNLNAPHGFDFVSDVPEPSSIALMGLVLMGAVLARKRLSA